MKFLIILLFFTSCSDANFEKYSELESLRILGIVADTPEVDGTLSSSVDVTLTPYIADFRGEGRTFTVTVATCIDSGLTQGGSAECEDGTIETYPNGNTFDTSTLESDDYIGAMDSITISIDNPSELISEYSDYNKFNGVNYLVLFNFKEGNDSLTIIKNLKITTRGDLNTNPDIDAITLNGVELTEAPTVDGTIDFTVNTQAESYPVMKNGGDVFYQSERFMVTWFYTDGKATPFRILESQDSSFKLDNEEDLIMAAVIRDFRGGTDILILR